MPSPSRTVALRQFILCGLISSVLIALSSEAQAQESPQSMAATEDEVTDIVVTAPRIRGSIETDVPPDLELDPVAIEGYGASNITELLAALSTQTRTGRGRDGYQIYRKSGISLQKRSSAWKLSRRKSR